MNNLKQNPSSLRLVPAYYKPPATILAAAGNNAESIQTNFTRLNIKQNQFNDPRKTILLDEDGYFIGSQSFPEKAKEAAFNSLVELLNSGEIETILIQNFTGPKNIDGSNIASLKVELLAALGSSNPIVCIGGTIGMDRANVKVKFDQFELKEKQNKQDRVRQRNIAGFGVKDSAPDSIVDAMGECYTVTVANGPLIPLYLVMGADSVKRVLDKFGLKNIEELERLIKPHLINPDRLIIYNSPDLFKNIPTQNTNPTSFANTPINPALPALQTSKSNLNQSNQQPASLPAANAFNTIQQSPENYSYKDRAEYIYAYTLDPNKFFVSALCGLLRGNNEVNTDYAQAAKAVFITLPDSFQRAFNQLQTNGVIGVESFITLFYQQWDKLNLTDTKTLDDAVKAVNFEKFL